MDQSGSAGNTSNLYSASGWLECPSRHDVSWWKFCGVSSLPLTNSGILFWTDVTRFLAQFFELLAHYLSYRSMPCRIFHYCVPYFAECFQDIKINKNVRMNMIRSWKLRLTAAEIRCADLATPSIRKVGTNFADKRRSLGRYSSFAD
jgi:hypothetical protein